MGRPLKVFIEIAPGLQVDAHTLDPNTRRELGAPYRRPRTYKYKKRKSKK